MNRRKFIFGSAGAVAAALTLNFAAPSRPSSQIITPKGGLLWPKLEHTGTGLRYIADRQIYVMNFAEIEARTLAYLEQKRQHHRRILDDLHSLRRVRLL